MACFFVTMFVLGTLEKYFVSTTMRNTSKNLFLTKDGAPICFAWNFLLLEYQLEEVTRGKKNPE